MNSELWKDILPLVEKPSRYIGGEVNSIRKERSRCKLSFALAFPDTYEVGMSHLGLQILYAILNSVPEISAERFYSPWPDMEFQMRKNNIQLSSLESHIPLKDFDIVGFSLQYELSYTNVLNMLELGGIPTYARDRKKGAPLVIGGGPCTFNPVPVSAFFDAFVIGEGEEVILEISQAVMEGKKKGYKRERLLELLAAIEGIYVPTVHTQGERIKKRIVSDINRWSVPFSPVVPLMKTIHDRVTLEIARGCTRGCRFCQAGMVWRPGRERLPEILVKMADEMLSSTGHDELSLLSLSSGDYSMIEDLLTELMNRYYEKRVALALPSMRVETLTQKLIEEIKRVRKTSFTLAPEAGTQRLRNVINKGNTEEDLLSTTRKVFDAGWRSIKLYFMLGLPGERREDLNGIVDLTYRVFREGENRRQVTVSLSTFVPKPHTPFQWCRQIGLGEILERQELLKKTIQNRNLKIKWHDGRMSLLEGIFSRGDERLSTLLESAFRLGCRFDGWSDRLKFNLWEQAIRETGIRIEDYMRERNITEELPWDRIDCGINKDFLTKELQKSLGEELTADCRFGTCHNCGVCDHDRVKIITAKDSADTVGKKKVEAKKEDSPREPKKFRIKFAKEGTSRLLSHLETSSALIRGIKQSGISFIYSKGFHPHPKMSFPFATSVGMESLGEYADIQIEKPGEDIERLTEKANSFLPSGLKIVNIREIQPNTDSLSKIIKGFKYEIILPEKIPLEKGEWGGLLDKKIETFLRSDEFIILREKKGKQIKRNIRPIVNTLFFDRTDNRIKVSLLFGKDWGVKPSEILAQVIGLDNDVTRIARVIKTDTIFHDSSQGLSEL
ncbi:MAG: TIGR03960 family B12-binding radical SAM protein [Thermodesulfobacteriota bacterium]|nr:TIGR03960 family B12-binding radical SAM protein [Thermodesulfobacteriota bacterium]